MQYISLSGNLNFSKLTLMLKSYILLALSASLFFGCIYINPSDDYTLSSKCGNEWYNPSSKHCFDNIVKSNDDEKFIVDNRDGRIYRYTVIGTQIWLAENLQYRTSNTKCYDNNPDNCEVFGVLYDWNTAKMVCPSGWHLPSDVEWYALRDFVNSHTRNKSGKLDNKLMANSTLWVSGKGTDEFGFAALPGGYYRHEGYFLTIQENAIFWSATTGAYAGSAHVHHICPLLWVREVDGLYTNNSWVNVRCVKD